MVGSGQAVFTGRQHHLGEGEMIQIGDDARIGGRQSSAIAPSPSPGPIDSDDLALHQHG